MNELSRLSGEKAKKMIANDKKQRKALTKEKQYDIIQTMTVGYSEANQ